ncbi:MAG: hypothetical protein Q8K08_13385 [Pseudotabrizicola sp.]|nr:hypothetical protein [Pseudotabrizicola sp.]
MLANILKKTGAVVGLMFLAAMVTVINPSVGQIFAVAVLGVSGWSVFKPIPRIGLGNRAYSATVLVLVGLFALGMSSTELEKRDPARMAELRATNPDRYLDLLKQTDEAAWQAELETMTREAEAELKAFADAVSQADQVMAEAAAAKAEMAAAKVAKLQAMAEEAKRQAQEAEATKLARAAEAERIAREKAAAAKLKAEADAATKLERDLAAVRESIEKFEFALARGTMLHLNASGIVPEAFRAEIEVKVKGYADTFSHEVLKSRQSIYELLAVIRPENAAYQKMVDDVAQQIQKQAKAAIGRMKPKLDKVESITWLHHPNQPKYTNSRSTAFLYIGTKERQKPWLRMRVQYAASDWLFVENVVAWVDGVKYPLIAGPFERDNHSTIWEWRDVSPDDYHLSVLRSLAEGKEAILRFEGMQYKRDATLSAGDKKGILETLAAFQVMQAGG